MERLDKLKRLFDANILTEEDRAFIRDLCKEFHLAFEPRNTRCQNSYKDQIIIIMAEIKKKNATKKGCKWSMIEPHGSDGLIINGELFNNATLNDKMAKKLIAYGLERFLYENQSQK